MQNVSPKWRNIHKQTLLPEAFVELTIGVGDPDAQSKAEASDNGHEDFSDVRGVINESTDGSVKYATLEPYLWLLDGSFKLLDEEDEDEPEAEGSAVVGVAIVGSAVVGRGA